jgi:hypothetical protein
MLFQHRFNIEKALKKHRYDIVLILKKHRHDMEANERRAPQGRARGRRAWARPPWPTFFRGWNARPPR